MTTESNPKINDFMPIYNKCYRLAAAVFAVSRVMDQSEDIGKKIKNLSLEMVSLSVNLKDVNFVNAKNVVSEIEKSALLLMSFFDMAAIAGLVSPMNGSIIKEEFEAFMLELNKFTQNFETNKNFSVKSIFTSSDLVSLNNSNHQLDGFSKPEFLSIESKSVKSVTESVVKNGGGLKRKDQRKNTILSFIKGHNNSSIKDIVPNIIGCSEKTIQRELIELIKEGKIKKTGERRWSKYSIA